MNVLHYVDQEDLTKVAGEQLSKLILSSRYGTLEVAAGGGGIYGKVLKE
jgi:PHP family Zn ribbon phosphoesterase